MSARTIRIGIAVSLSGRYSEQGRQCLEGVRCYVRDVNAANGIFLHEAGCRVPVELSVRLGSTNIPLRQLLALQEGDVVPLKTRVGEPVVAPVQGRPKFRGRIGVRGKHFAFQVTELMES